MLYGVSVIYNDKTHSMSNIDKLLRAMMEPKLELRISLAEIKNFDSASNDDFFTIDDADMSQPATKKASRYNSDFEGKIKL